MEACERRRAVYARVVRVSACGMYGFAITGSMEGDILFHQFQNRLIIYAYGEPVFILDDRREEQICVGDHIVAVVSRSDQGLKAECWAREFYPRAWNYDPPLYQRCGSGPGGIKAAFEQFCAYVQEHDDYDYALEYAPINRRKLHYVAAHYLIDRVEALVMRPALADKRPWTATAVIAFMTSFAREFDLDLPLASVSAAIRRQPRPEQPASMVERLVKDVLTALNDDRPLAAYALMKDALNREQELLDAKATVKGAPLSKLGSFLDYQFTTPLSAALDEDLALSFLAMLAKRRAAEFPATITARIRDILHQLKPFADMDLDALWTKAHDQDPSFVMHQDMRIIVEDVVARGDRKRINLIRPLLCGPYEDLRPLVDEAPALNRPSWRDSVAYRLEYLLKSDQIEKAVVFFDEAVTRHGGSFAFIGGDARRQQIYDTLVFHRACWQLEMETMRAQSRCETNNLLLRLERANEQIRATPAWKKALARVAELVTQYPKLQTRVATLITNIDSRVQVVRTG